MTITAVRPIHASVIEPGSELFVEAYAVDGGGLVSLTVESVSQLVASESLTTYYVRLVGTVDATLTTPGRHRVHQGDHDFSLNLTRIGRRGNLVSYAAVVVEAK
jgi:hypothetical protein